jgi:chromosome segregation ATPase
MSMAGDVKSRYEIVSDLANKRIELITELGQYKSKSTKLNSDFESIKIKQKRELEKLKDRLSEAIEGNHRQAEQRRKAIEKAIKQQENEIKQLENQIVVLKERHKENLETENNFVALLLDDSNTTKNHSITVSKTEQEQKEQLEDGKIGLDVELKSNQQAIDDIADKIKSIDMALEAIKSISANNEKAKE